MMRSRNIPGVLSALSHSQSSAHKTKVAVAAATLAATLGGVLSAPAAFTCPSSRRRATAAGSLAMSSRASDNGGVYGRLISVADAVSLQSGSGGPPVAFVDASWHLGASDPDADRKSFEERGPRISGSVFFDINDVADKEGKNGNLPHMMPPPGMFSAAMDAYGITNSHRVILYGNDHSALSVPRAAVTFLSMGHGPALVHAMQGSVDDWIAAGGAVEEGPLPENLEKKRTLRVAEDLAGWNGAAATYCASRPKNVLSKAELLSVVEKVASGEDTSTYILDARSAGRFAGTAPEPRAGLRGGHMPGATSMPYVGLMADGSNVAFEAGAELSATFAGAGVDVAAAGKKFVVTCGSGVTACHLATGLAECGVAAEDIYLYDGAWCEWGGDPDVPIVT
eukprot:CAMPEP_0194324322 /NCGR_PEP_ID=MMETSP0171-20130528/27409_1 /TAXON_ID=218684 /ORGANISM="Corethron pennatum, Strain L29A3" /LENGTH=394 /DNA_ID=CAMNT_0039083191 /DNA_START=19 /DNA_END=1203 /DNA_ORIENTATION=+